MAHMKDSLKRLARGAGFPSILVLLVAVIICAQGYALYRSYQATWLLATRSAENVLHTIAANIERNLEIIELSLIGLETAVTH